MLTDAAFETGVRKALNKPDGDITRAEAAAVESLNLELPGDDWSIPRITDLSDLQYFPNLTSLFLGWALQKPGGVDISPIGKLTKLNETLLTADQTSKMARAIASEKQWQAYIDTKGQNFAISLEGIGRFRINIFTQQQRTGMVIRVITTEIPDFDQMKLPPILKSIVQEKRGLILLVGGTGSGKSTTLAAMLGVRNKETHGHIITIEDPVEYVHPHGNCIVTHREVGIDTVGWFDALKDTLRQAPDVILIGEIRDHDTMEYALNFAETGHLCMATLHANSANQAIDRIVNFFPIEKH